MGICLLVSFQTNIFRIGGFIKLELKLWSPNGYDVVNVFKRFIKAIFPHSLHSDQDFGFPNLSAISSLKKHNLWKC